MYLVGHVSEAYCLDVEEGRTPHVFEEDAVLRLVETLHYGSTRRGAGEDVVNFEFFLKLVSLEIA